jgi:hypothetical protein
MVIARVLFRRSAGEPHFVGQMLRSEIPVVRCGACGKGVALPVVGQSCSANCGAEVAEVIIEGAGILPRGVELLTAKHPLEAK